MCCAIFSFSFLDRRSSLLVRFNLQEGVKILFSKTRKIFPYFFCPPFLELRILRDFSRQKRKKNNEEGRILFWKAGHSFIFLNVHKEFSKDFFFKIETLVNSLKMVYTQNNVNLWDLKLDYKNSCILSRTTYILGAKIKNKINKQLLFIPLL